VADHAGGSRPVPAESGPVWIATLGLGSIASYLGTVLLLDETVLGAVIADWMLLPLLLVLVAAIFIAARVMLRAGRVSRNALYAAGVLGIAVSGSLLAMDVAFTVYLNRGTDTDADQGVRRANDPRLWQGEVLPRLYQPSEWNFFLHKPGVVVEADAYGEFYDTKMLASPTLRDRVLELRHVDYRIDEHGFRETTPLADARVFALGDSYVFGFGLAQDRIWTEQLEQLIGRPVYNLGVSATGPGHQQRLLRYLLDTHPDDVVIDRLLWMIFEGNDLENSYEERRAAGPTGGSLLRGTVVESLRAVPETLKRESVLHRLVAGQLRSKTAVGASSDPTLVDGVRIPYPLYDSAVHGPRMFNPDNLERARRPRAYVLDHPNWPRLRESFGAMAELARAHGFAVTVVLAPSAARLYAGQYEGFPAISERPWFLEEVGKLARETGFEVVDLVPALRPYAASEMLYFRDDHHWNARGNRVVAELLAPLVQTASR